MNGARLPLYRGPELRAAVAAGLTVFSCEGERKADRLAAALRVQKIGAAVTTIAGGANAALTVEHLAQLHGVTRIVVLADSDRPGRNAAAVRAERIARAYPTADVRVVDLYPDRRDGSDIADWLSE